MRNVLEEQTLPSTIFHRQSSMHSILVTQSEFNLIAPIFQTTQNVAIMSPMVKMKLKAITCSTEARRQHLASPHT